MSSSSSTAIILLLAAILYVLVYGAPAFKDSVNSISKVAVGLVAIYVVVVGASRVIRYVRGETSAAKIKNEPWLWHFLFWPGLLGMVVIVGLAALLWFQGFEFKDALEGALYEIPYGWVPLAILSASIVVMFAEMAVAAIRSAPEWLPTVPARIAHPFRIWLLLLCGPVMGPLGRWQNIREARARGEKISAIEAGATLAGTFAASVLLWLPAALFPAGLIVALVASLR